MAEKVKKESRIKKFFKDYKSEFKKIVWPTWNDTYRQSGVVSTRLLWTRREHTFVCDLQDQSKEGRKCATIAIKILRVQQQ